VKKGVLLVTLAYNSCSGVEVGLDLELGGVDVELCVAIGIGAGADRKSRAGRF